MNPIAQPQPQRCPVCHAPNSTNAASCANCGLVFATYGKTNGNGQPVKIPLGQAAAADRTITCPRCGWSTQMRANVCARCGNPLYRPLAPGESLSKGHYTIQRALSKGGMGDIYLATDHDAFDRIVVIKAMLDYFDPANQQEIQAARERFVHEARTLSTLSHPAVPKIFTYFQDGPHNYIVMEYIEGRDLEQQLTHTGADGSMIAGKAYPHEDVIRWGIALCRVLEYLASRKPHPVVHHDIKPANILLDVNGDIRLVDFGTAKARLLRQVGGGVGLQKSSIYGTQGYAPVEQYKGKSEPRSDVYALASTLYHLATDDDPRSHPFSFPQLKQLGDFGRALGDALVIDVNKRPSAAELRQRLENLLSPLGMRAIQTPDGTDVTSEQDLVAWCELHWSEAITWLYDRDKFAEQIERLWGKNKLANDIRKTVQRHAFGGDHSAGLDAVLALIDPQDFGVAKVRLSADYPAVDFGTLTAYTRSNRQITLTNTGRRYLYARLQYPKWTFTPTNILTLVPGQSILLTLTADMRRVALGGGLVGNLVAVNGTNILLDLPVEAHVSRWRTFLRRFWLLLTLLLICMLASPWLVAGAYHEGSKAWHYRQGVVALDNYDYPLARAEFQQVLVQQSDYRDASTLVKESYYRQAQAALDGGLWQTARSQLAALQQLDPRYKDEQTLLKESYYRPAKEAMNNQDWAGVQAQLQPLVQMDASYSDAMTMLKESYYVPARTALEQGRWQEARNQLNALLKYDSNYKDEQILLRESYYRPLMAAIQNQQWQDAADLLAQLQKLDPLYKDEATLVTRYPDLMRQAAIKRSADWQNGKVDTANTFAGHTASVVSIAFSPDGQMLASGSLDNTVRIWRVPNGQVLQIIDTGYNTLWNLAYSPDGQTLAISGEDSSGNPAIKFWTVYDGQIALSLNAPKARVRSMAFSPNGEMLASAGDDRTITIWSVRDGRILKTLSQPRATVYSVTFSPDGQYLASGSADQKIRIYRVDDWSTVREIGDQNNVIYSVAFSPDGQYLASAGADRAVWLFRVSDGSVVRKLIGHTERVYDVKFAPDGQTLASTGDDQTIRLWSIKSSLPIQTIPRSSVGMSNIAFNPNGQSLAAGIDGNIIQFWAPNVIGN